MSIGYALSGSRPRPAVKLVPTNTTVRRAAVDAAGGIAAAPAGAALDFVESAETTEPFESLFLCPPVHAETAATHIAAAIPARCPATQFPTIMLVARDL